MNKIPVYLLHGSLGCGKTTVLNALIASVFFRNVVVIENEFANYNLDKDSIHDGVKIHAVSGACICCSSGQELQDALEEIAAQGNVGALFIETTGIASSVQLIQQFMLARIFDDHFRLVRNIFVIDLLEDDVMSLKSGRMLDVAMADIFILSKADLVLPTIADGFMTFLRAVSDAPVIVSRNGDGIAAHDIYSDANSRADAVLLDNISLVTDRIAHGVDMLYQVIFPTKRVPPEKIIEMIAYYGVTEKLDIHRTKGVITDLAGRRYAIQTTKKSKSATPTLTDHEDVLVLIGKNITRETVQPLMNELCEI